MPVTFRPATPADADPCGRICFEAFKSIAEAHGFPPDLPSVEVGVGLVSSLIAHPQFYGVVAEADGRVVGSNFLDERTTVAGIGPITVDPGAQNQAVGRGLMQQVLDRATERRFGAVRLVQAAYHGRSLSLYTKLGFVVREPLAILQGPALGVEIPGRAVRAASDGDLEACDRLCRRVHGHDRHGELADAIGQGTARVIEHADRITGYATSIAFFGHAVGETNEDVAALIGAAESFAGPGFHVPMRNTELFRWCLDHGLHVVQPMTLMSLGFYNHPAGAFLPSVLY